MKIKYIFRIKGCAILIFGETKKQLLEYAKLNFPHLKKKWIFSNVKNN